MKKKKLFVSMLLVNFLAACASQQPKVTVEESKPTSAVDASKRAAAVAAADAAAAAATAAAIAAAAEAATTAAATAATTAAANAPIKTAAVDSLNDPKSMLAKRSVYYPFDVYVVQDDDKPTVQAHASYLSGHPNRNVRLEGNCDERGSNEYNLALGQRRADGVRKMLLVGGVRESQIVTVSYGEEKPKATGHDEASWAKNRRTDLNFNYKP